ncbi:DUF898 family protein, partial [Escherichia coli]
MAQVINKMDVPSHSFVFHGTGERYFLICVVNVLLTIITLGIYLPWALMKCKRYLYANMEVNGQRFSYGITGGNVFVSCLVFVFFGNDSNLLIMFYVQIMPDDFVMQLHR